MHFELTTRIPDPRIPPSPPRLVIPDIPHSFRFSATHPTNLLPSRARGFFQRQYRATPRSFTTFRESTRKGGFRCAPWYSETRPQGRLEETQEGRS